ncbi:MAG: DUF4115 domain-containing protein [Magnetococcales bacterium]|nr:DUF4115 domain-containing protein [Magnetococcales bacterium]NGZ27010.1 DUF4115 domain-containing protein [Magnetococcales bacterium]
MKNHEGSKREQTRSRLTGTEEGGWTVTENHVGEVLRRAREDKGISLKDVSKDLKIRYPLLDDLEQGRFDQLPGQTSAVGFVKLYIRYLGLSNEQELVAKFLSQMKPQESRLYYEPPAVDSRNRPGPLLVIGSLLVFAACFVGYEKYWAERPLLTLEEIRQSVFQAVEGVGISKPEEAEKPATPNRKVVAEKVVTAPPPPASQSVEEKKNLTRLETSSTNPTSRPPEEKPAVKPPEPPPPAKVEKPPVVVERSIETIPAATSKKTVEVMPPPPEEEDDSHPNKPSFDSSGSSALVATEKVWIQIKNSQKQIIKELVLKEGEVFPLTEEYAYLTVGNAGGLQVRQGGKDSTLLGPKGKVLRNMDISSAAIQKKVAASP